MSLHSNPMFQEYKVIIKQAILESETIQDSNSKLDIGKLCSRFKVIYKAAQFDGLSESDVDTLIDEAMPDFQNKTDQQK